MLADMIKLMADHCAMSMDGVRDFTKMWNDLIRTVAEIAPR